MTKPTHREIEGGERQGRGRERKHKTERTKQKEGQKTASKRNMQSSALETFKMAIISFHM